MLQHPLIPVFRTQFSSTESIPLSLTPFSPTARYRQALPHSRSSYSADETKKLRNTATLIILTNLKQMYTSTKLIQMKKKINKHTRAHAPSVGHNNRVFACFLPPATETMPHVFSHHSVVVVTGVTISAIILGTETYEHTSTHRSTITIARCCNESIASSSPFQNSGQY